VVERSRKSFSFPLTCDADLGILPAMVYDTTITRPPQKPIQMESLPGSRVVHHTLGAVGVLNSQRPGLPADRRPAAPGLRQRASAERGAPGGDRSQASHDPPVSEDVGRAMPRGGSHPRRGSVDAELANGFGSFGCLLAACRNVACAGDLRADLNDWWFAPRGEWSSGSQVERGGQWWIPTFPWLQGILPVMPARSSHPRCGAAGRLPLGSSSWWSTSASLGLGDRMKEDPDFISDLGLRLGVLVGVVGSIAMLALLLGAVVALWRWALGF